ncbi:MAG: UDP-N-acetylmuramoyl-L-alanyl-D-glutamate--2,6-diaminopimelate ligase [Patescibacteria group bacterium]|nr:UDP-N-acetylmuramoyl-L-alanyl-D-glutamate--2,6-diaminopimelate ligase [Patescibacteria group bacterium]
MIKDIIRKIKPVVSFYHFLYSFAGAVWYRFPSRKITVIGVTGTNGKTTTVDFASRIMKKGGLRVTALSSIKFEIAGEEEENLFKMTMPGRAFLQKMIRKAVDKKCDVVIMEVTSEGIKQHRHRFINFQGACFTNLSPEHIESHGGFDNYRKEKEKLFEKTKNLHIINIDDENANYFLKHESKEKILCTIKKDKKENVLKAEKIESTANGTTFSIDDKKFNLAVAGKFNVYNALSAIAIASSQGVSLNDAKEALQEKFTVRGRMEQVISSPFKVIIDYAVTPDALEQLYKEVKENFSPNKIIAVFGACGGGRDKWKRPKLGEIAGRYCDYIILTNEDPYDEDPEEILNDIEKGLPKNTAYEKIIDREEAIKKALKQAKEKDIVIITGKGCEPWMCLSKGKKILWSDKKIIKNF